jgi:hypothetical protein
MHGDFRFSPLENGLDFLLSSLEHLTNASSLASQESALNANEKWQQKRHLKYALLHLCSSIELLFKVRLQQEHWSLVFDDISKADKQSQDIGNFKSVIFHDLVDRLIRICNVDLSDKQKRDLTNLRDRRNRMEHFGTVDSLPAVSTSVASMVSFIVDFVEATFEPDQLAEEEILIADIRSKLGACNAFVEQRWKEIRTDVERFHSVIECPTCQQKALEVDGGVVRCRFCYHTTDPDDAANDYIARVLGYSSRYSVEKDGGEWPLNRCPQCGHNTLVGTEEMQSHFCFNCGEEWSSDSLERCCECNEFYAAEEGDGRICTLCFRAKVERD